MTACLKSIYNQGQKKINLHVVPDSALIPDSTTPLSHNYPQGNTLGLYQLGQDLEERRGERPDSHPDAGLYSYEGGIKDRPGQGLAPFCIRRIEEVVSNQGSLFS